MSPLLQNLINKYPSIPQEKLDQLRDLIPDEIKEWEKNRPLIKNLNDFVTCYPKMLTIKEQIKILSTVDDSVLIIGPTGTGKECLAKALHGDRLGPFIDINCAGLPEHLIESELFGHVKGAFTGAHTDKVGLLHSAHNGTFFFDEIGELPLIVQAKLLRAIQEKTIRKVGSDYERDPKLNIPINCRFVAATNRRIKEDMVPYKLFREDLYYRLARFTLTIDPLSERTLDIPLIIRQIICKDRDIIKHDIEDIDEFAKYIIEHGRNQLTGNVRQLQNIVRNYHVLGEMPKFVKI